MVTKTAARGIKLGGTTNSPYLQSPTKRRKRRTSSNTTRETLHHQKHNHEINTAQYAYGSRLSSSDSVEGGEQHQLVVEVHREANTVGEQFSEELLTKSRVTRTNSRRCSRRRSSVRRRTQEGAWHERVADKFVKEAEANDFTREQVVAYASSLLSQHIEAIKDTKSSQFDEDVTKESYNNTVSSLNKSNQRQGFPVAALPPSLIKWPGNNNNKQKRLTEIKKQVKLLSSIIKMTIEGAQDLTNVEGAASVAGKGNPAPFSQYADMTTIPMSGSEADTFLPTIEQIKEFLKANKVKEAKGLLRTAGGSVACPARPRLWQELCKRQTTEQFSDSFYFDTLQQIYGSDNIEECRPVLPAFVDQQHTGRCLTAEGMAACRRIISVLGYYYPPITHAPALCPLAGCLLLYMNEADVYNSLSALVCSSKVTFVTQTKIANEVAWRTTLVLAKKHVGSGFSTLEKYGIDNKQIEAAFQNWLWWILEGVPVPHMVRILDCFLLEGWKVLVRAALAIFHLYMRQVGRDASLAATLSTKGLGDAIMLYCNNLTISPAKLLKRAFGIRALSMSEVQKVMSRTEGVLQKGGGCIEPHAAQEIAGMQRSVSLEGLPTASAQANVQMLSHTLNVKELLTIWNWMPVRMTMYQPSLLYTTEEHGSSLTSFYQRVEHHEPTILLVRTTCDHVFGAYCSSAWSERHRKDEFGHKQTYYGTGETFLFTLRPVVAKYQWVGITQQKENSALKNVKHSSELFMHGDDDMITIGGGDGQGINLDHELQFGKTETCLTFDNPPLCPTKDFEVKVVEVYGININSA